MELIESWGENLLADAASASGIFEILWEAHDADCDL